MTASLSRDTRFTEYNSENKVSLAKRCQHSRGISIAIATYYRPRYLSLLLDSIRKLSYPKDCIELIIVRDKNDHQALELAMKIKASDNLDIRVLELDKNMVTRARNIGIKEASNDIVVVVDDDIILNPATLQRTLELIQEENVAAVVFPALSPHPSLEERISYGRFLDIITDHVYTVTPVTSFKKTLLLKEIGLYREDMGPPATIHEDWELGTRIRRKGYRIIMDGFTPQIHKPTTNGKTTMHNQGGIAKHVISYIRSYVNKHWWSFFEVMKISPLQQKLEYLSYFLLPWIGAALLTTPLYLLAYIAIITATNTLYALIRSYYRRYSFRERLIYPNILLAIRVLRINAAVIGYMKAQIRRDKKSWKSHEVF